MYDTKKHGNPGLRLNVNLELQQKGKTKSFIDIHLLLRAYKTCREKKASFEIE
jgi:hypothetical protein